MSMNKIRFELLAVTHFPDIVDTELCRVQIAGLLFTHMRQKPAVDVLGFSNQDRFAVVEQHIDPRFIFHFPNILSGEDSSTYGRI